MFGENKNIKDTAKDISDSTDIAIKDNPFSVSYTKTNKLITALYMVTDIIDKDEPLRNKLRTLGVEVISDIHIAPSNICNKITQVMSFLEIAKAMNIISHMNCNILRKEFIELDQSIKESTNVIGGINKEINLSEFFMEELSSPSGNKPKNSSIGHIRHTRIGVQKGHTLMKALSDRISTRGSLLSDNSINTSERSFDNLKKERRDEIVKIVRNYPTGATITDIKIKAQGVLISCGEKTLQRELIAMVKDDVLYKTGEKRWSRYFITQPEGFNLLQNN